MSKLDVITMILIQRELNIPLDILRYLNEFVKYEEINDKNIREAIKLWFNDKELCLFIYGHISDWDTSKVTNMSYLFYDKRNFNEDISNWNVSNVEGMSFMFYKANSFNQDISNWNVSNVANIYHMFSIARSFNCDISRWNVSNVEDMSYMFKEATSFNCDLNNWNVSNVNDMNEMFKGATSFDRNNISNWNLRRVKQKEYIWR